MDSVKKKSLLLLPLILFCLSLSAQNHLKLVKEVVQNYKSHESMAYDVFYRIGFTGFEKPMIINGNVLIKREKEDTVFGAKVLYDFTINMGKNRFKMIKYYDLQHIYRIDLLKHSITRFDPAKGESFAIKQQVDYVLLLTYFLHPENLLKQIEDKNNKVIYTDKKKYLIVTIDYPDDKRGSDRRKIIFMNKSDKTIDMAGYGANPKGKKNTNKSNQWKLSHIKFDKVSDKDFERKVRKYFRRYKTEVYKPRPDDYYALMEKGELAPSITGHFFPDYSKEVTISPSKITILDFWFTTCAPCIKAIPTLNRLKSTFGDKIQIIGVNAVEYEERFRDNIVTSIRRTPMLYKILLAESIPKKYNIKAYPTLYIIGKDHKVKYAKSGTIDAMYTTLSTVIKGLLND